MQPKANRIICEGTAPAYWASYFINGDASGLDETDKRQADAFADWLGGHIVDCSDEPDFMYSHDAAEICGTLAADCLTYRALVDLVPVLFRKDSNGEITAVFPTLPGSPGMMTCYAHIGQHGSCSADWLATTKPAAPDEYAALLRELTRAPYHYRLKVYSRRAAWMESERCRAESAQ